jgi:3-oxoacyl-[acyl-carrier protein] reductase
MAESNFEPDLSGRRVLIPGGTGAVGEGIVRRYLAAGAEVVVPTRSTRRSDEFRDLLGTTVSERLHLVVHDYTTFAGAEDLAVQTTRFLGGVDDVVAPIGGWWSGGRLWEIDEQDWTDAFVGLSTAHMAVLRACLPRMSGLGAYSIVVGDSSSYPVPGSGLVSMEQAALLMMQRVASAEAEGAKRVFALVLGPVRTRAVDGDPSWVSTDQVGAAAVALSASDRSGGIVSLHDAAEVARIVALPAAGKQRAA